MYRMPVVLLAGSLLIIPGRAAAQPQPPAPGECETCKKEFAGGQIIHAACSAPEHGDGYEDCWVITPSPDLDIWDCGGGGLPCDGEEDLDAELLLVDGIEGEREFSAFGVPLRYYAECPALAVVSRPWLGGSSVSSSLPSSQ